MNAVHMDPNICAALFLTAGAVWMDLRSTKVDNGWLLFWLAVSVIMQVIRAGPGIVGSADAGLTCVGPGIIGSADAGLTCVGPGIIGSADAGLTCVGPGSVGPGSSGPELLLQTLLWILPGMAVPLLLLFPFFYFRMLGAADIKLLAVLGSFLGRKAILYCIFYTFLCAAVLSLLIFLIDGGIQIRIRYLAGWLKDYLETGKRRPYLRPGLREESLHMTVPMLMAVLLRAGGWY